MHPLPGPWPPAPSRDPALHPLARTAPSLASVGTSGPSDGFCWLLHSGNIAARLAFVLPLIAAQRQRLGGLPAICYLPPREKDRPAPALSGGGLGPEMELSWNEPPCLLGVDCVRRKKCKRRCHDGGGGGEGKNTPTGLRTGATDAKRGAT